MKKGLWLFVFSLSLIFFVHSVSAANETGFFYIVSSPSSAGIFIDGVYKGNTPNITEVSAQTTHNVQLVKQGYQNWQGNYLVSGGATLLINATLVPAPTQQNGTLSINSSPLGANIYISMDIIEGVHTANFLYLLETTLLY